MKKKIDEYQIYEKHNLQIYNQVKNDPYAQSIGIQLTKFEAGFAEATLEVQSKCIRDCSRCSYIYASRSCVLRSLQCIWKNIIRTLNNNSVY